MKQILTRLLQAGTLLWGSVIFFFSILGPPPIAEQTTDLVLHFSAYLLLAFIAIHAFKQKMRTRLIVLAIACYGVIMEVLQHFIGRSMSVYDASANIIGVITAVAIIQIVERFSSLQPRKS
jgi:VanZ family protein